jgi:hypothetical protein
MHLCSADVQVWYINKLYQNCLPEHESSNSKSVEATVKIKI